jgi:hypothetical protein
VHHEEVEAGEGRGVARREAREEGGAHGPEVSVGRPALARHEVEELEPGAVRTGRDREHLGPEPAGGGEDAGRVAREGEGAEDDDRLLRTPPGPSPPP